MDGQKPVRRIAPVPINRRHGAPCGLNEKLIELLCDARRIGLPQRDIASFCHVPVDTLRTWLSRGRQDRTAGRKSVHAQFVEQYDKADAERMAQSVLRIQQAAKGGHHAQRITTTVTQPDGSQTTTVVEKTAEPAWKADAWMLERTRPGDFGPSSRTEITGKEGGPVEARFGWLDLLNAAEKLEKEGEVAEAADVTDVEDDKAE